MYVFLNKVLIGCFGVMLSSHAIGHTNHFCDKAKVIVFNFAKNEQNEDWNEISKNVYKFKSCKCEMAPVFYYIYQMKVNFPNSHALLDISPGEFILSQKLKMNEQLTILKNCEKKNYLPFINSMIKQKFDIELSNTANDLKNKLI